MISTHSVSGLDDAFNEEKVEKNTAPAPGKVRYSDINNLTEEDRTELCAINQKSFDKGLTNLTEEDRAELCAINQESFDKGHIPEDRTHSFLKPISKPGKDHR